MNTIEDKLNLLRQTKADIKTAIEAKGVTNVGDVFAEYPSKIASIESGGGGGELDLASVGYTLQNSPQDLTDALTYAKEIKDKWGTVGWRMDYNKAKIFPYIENLDFKEYAGQPHKWNLIYFPIITYAGKSLGYMFKENFMEVFEISIPYTTDIYEAFAQSKYIKKIILKESEKVNNCQNIFMWCPELKHVEMSFKSVTNAYNAISYCKNMTFALFKDFGTQESFVEFKVGGENSWGVGTAEDRQSLIDTLITYSFDRASAGYPTCTITLNPASKAVLTESEIAQIAAKGYTIA